MPWNLFEHAWMKIRDCGERLERHICCATHNDRLAIKAATFLWFWTLLYVSYLRSAAEQGNLAWIQ